MNKLKSALIKTGKFLRKNVYYVVIVVAVAAICAIVGVTVSKTKQAKNSTPVVNDTNIERPQDKPADKPDPVVKPDPVKPDPVVFIVPVKDSAVGASFSETELVFSKTLEQWSTHRQSTSWRKKAQAYLRYGTARCPKSSTIRCTDTA